MDIVYPPPSFPFSLKEYPINPFHIKLSGAWDSIYASHMIASQGIRFPQGINEDVTWFIMTMTSATKIIYINKALYIYRQYRSGSILHTVSKQNQYSQCNIYLRNYIDCIQWLTHTNMIEEYYPYIQDFIIESLYRLKGKTVSEYSALLKYTARYFPYTLYIQIQRKLRKKLWTRYAQYIFSITHDRVRNQRILTFFGLRIYIK